jgi:hypothetical protein
MLHRAKLSTLPVRERLARSAAKMGAWAEATQILEELMHERPTAEGRVEAARLAMAIHRDRLHDGGGGRAAAVKLLTESPVDGEALDYLLSIGDGGDPLQRRQLFERARFQLLDPLTIKATDLATVRRIAAIARTLGDDATHHAALGACFALGETDPAAGQAILALSARKPRMPRVALTEAIFRQILAPGDEGPVARLFAVLGPTLAEALGPTVAGTGVTKRDKVDPKSGLALRNEIAAWVGAFGIREFDLFVGGKDPLGVIGVPGETPAIIIGASVNAPLSPTIRGRVARELFAMVRGSTITRWRDETAIASVVVAACKLADVRIESPSYAVLAEIEKAISKVISRKVKKMLPEVCAAIAQDRTIDPRAWSHRALASQNRVAAIASGDAALVLCDALGAPLERVAAASQSDVRVEEMIRFVLSPTYFEVRRALGLEGG